MAKAERECVIKNKEGLHFRPIMQFVELRGKFNSDVTIACEDREAEGGSPMELLMLVATQGSKVRIVAEGDDADAAVAALADLIESGFNE